MNNSSFFFLTTMFFCSLLITFLMKVHAIKRNIIDIPNLRSSHSTPTPRGGGLSIVLSFSFCLAFFVYFEQVEFMTGLTLLFSGLSIALIGFIDDHGHINAKWRLLVHFLAANAVLYCLGGLPVLNIFGFNVNFGIIGFVLAVIAIIWILNLFNFMDGIDGLASIESISTTFFAGLFLSIISPDSQLVLLYWLLSASVCGFLVLNFPPAKIFMGDAGSGYLGFMLAALALASAQIDQNMLWIWLTLLGVFIVDATFTVVHRLISGEKIYEAHRSHAYQFASRKFNSHLKVTLAVLAINLFWLAPIAFLIVNQTLNGSLALCIAYLPLILLAIKFNAGEVENNN